MEREYDKLVRDAIPEIIESNGQTPATRIVTGEEYAAYLGQKLLEEVDEYLESGDVDELADVLEVVHAIRKHRGRSAEELQERREHKAEQRGRFDEGIVLERVTS